MKIAILDADTVFSENINADCFKEFGEIISYGSTPKEKIAERIEDADIILCNKTQISGEDMKFAKKLKYIGLFATGYNNIDTAYTKENNIIVTNVPGYSSDAVAQHTFSLLLTLTNKTRENIMNEISQSQSKTLADYPYPDIELKGKTIGLLGLGGIGGKVADIALSFGMKVNSFRRSKTEKSGVNLVSLDTLLRESDILSLHCPLTKNTENIINEDSISIMKDGIIFINTSRGGLVDEQALADALKSGKIRYAGLDVLRNEPPKPDCPLLNLPNCIITPHIAWAGLDTRKRLTEIMVENIRAFLSGTPVNTV